MKALQIALLLLLPFFASAQTEKGTWMLGGTAGFSSRKMTNIPSSGFGDRLFLFNIAPQAGYFVTDNFALGVDLFLSDYVKSVGPYARFYYKKNFLQAKYQYEVFSRSDDNASVFDFSVGRAFFLKPNVAVEPEIYYFKRIDHFSEIGMRIGFRFYLF